MVQSLRGASLEERVTRLNVLVDKAKPAVKAAFDKQIEVSWIYHDSALEGQVFQERELRGALDHKEDPEETSTVAIYDEIRQQRKAIELIKDLAGKKAPISLDMLKKIYTTLIPEEGEGKGAPKYRKDMPLHRLYFHEIAQPDKIAYQMRQLVQWINSPDVRRSTHTVRLAAKAHYKMLHIYPFQKHSGKVARLLLNMILIRQSYPPVVIHATERHRYYDALKTSEEATAKIVTAALGSTVESTIRYFETA